MAKKINKESTLSSNIYRRSSSQECKVFPSGMVEQVLVQLAKHFSYPIELQVYLTGSSKNRINQVVVPEFIIGLGNRGEEEYSLKDMDYLGEFDGETKTMLAVLQETNELGIQVVAYAEKFNRDKNLFVPLSELVLDRPLVNYLPEDSIQELFPEKDVSEITYDHLSNLILTSNSLRKCTHSYFNKTIETVTFLIDYPLYVDLFTTIGSLKVMKGYLLNSLIPVNNKFMGGKSHGMAHIHYGYSEEQYGKNTFLQECHKIDEHFNELISPGDAVGLISRNHYLKLLSKGLVDSYEWFIGVTTLDPVNKDLIGSTYFHTAEIYMNKKDAEEFERLAIMSSQITDYSWMRDYYQIVRQYSSSKLPDYVDSII